MGIRADCEYLIAVGLSDESCVQTMHKQRIDEYTAAFASKFDTYGEFTISDVWRLLVAAWETPANMLQLGAAQHVGFHDFFELDVADIADPSPFFSAPTGFFALMIILAIVSSRN